MQQTWLLIILFECFWSFIHAKCYYPNGSEMEAYHSPCDKNKAVSMCCAPGDECRPDGLCLNPVRGLFRDGCTDPSWESSSCIKLCHAGLGLKQDGTSVVNLTRTNYEITICDNGSYCCGNNTYADDCCKLKQGFFLINGSATQANPISLQDPLTSSISFSSITSLTFSTTSVSISASTKPSSDISSTSKSSVSVSPQQAASQIGLIAGAAVGGAGSVVALILCALIWTRHRRTKSSHRNEMLQQPQSAAMASSSTPPSSARRNRGSELQLSQPPYGHNGSGEMDGTGSTFELDPSTTWHEVQ